MISNSFYAAIPLMALLAVAQTAIFARFPVLGVVPMVPFLIALLWGLLRGTEEGAVWAFCAGFFLDMFSIAPMGLLALSMMTAVIAATWIQEAFPTNRVLLPPVLILLATVIQNLLYLLFLRLLGNGSSLQALANLTNIIILHLSLAPPIYGLFFWIDRMIRPRTLQV